MKCIALFFAIGIALLTLSCTTFAEEVSPVEPAATAASPSVGSLALASDYIFRGLSQTNRKSAVQGGLEYDDASGVYAGFWASNISWLSDYSTAAAAISSHVELDFYAGYRGKFGDDLGYDVGIYTYYYPGSYPAGFTNANTTEVYAALPYKFVSLKYSRGLTNAFGFADTRNSDYLDLCANYEFVPTWLLNVHAGRQRIAGFGVASYTDYKPGITRNFDKGLALALAYFDTNADKSVYANYDNHFVGRSTGAVTLIKTF